MSGLVVSAPIPPRRRPPLNAWRRNFLGRVFGAIAAMQLPAGVTLAVALVQRAHLAPVSAALASLGLHLAASTILWHRLRWWIDDVRMPWWRAWLLEVPYAVYATACFLAAPLAWLFYLARAALSLGGAPVPAVLPWLVPLYAVAGLLTLWGSTVGRAWARVTRVEVPIRGLPPAFDGYRIAHLSDVHCGPHVPPWMFLGWARTARSLDPDLIALTGDLITTGEGYLDDVSAFVRALSARDGVFACMGNHDYFQTADGVVRALDGGGAELLRNRSTVVRRGDESIHLAGVDDRWTHQDDVVRALEGVPAEAAVVMLAHDPAGWPEIAARGVDLTLSGHTHGGQFGVPVGARLNLGRLASRFSAGLFRKGRAHLFVSRGVGTTGVPTRVGMAPEVALLTLRRA